MIRETEIVCYRIGAYDVWLSYGVFPLIFQAFFGVSCVFFAFLH